MLRGTLVNRFGLSSEDVAIDVDESPASANGRRPLKIRVDLSDSLLEKLAPLLNPEVEGSSRSDAGLRQLVQAMGETARRLGPENGWPQRAVEIVVPRVNFSWNGG
ncbi:MAG: hypothetical protein ACOZAG_01995 [Patescibacteria group bacterium]